VTSTVRVEITKKMTTCPAGSELAVKRLVAVELGQFKLFHVETSEVAVVVEWTDVMQPGIGVLQPRPAQWNVHQEVDLTRCLNYHAQLHNVTSTNRCYFHPNDSSYCR